MVCPGPAPLPIARRATHQLQHRLNRLLYIGAAIGFDLCCFQRFDIQFAPLL